MQGKVKFEKFKREKNLQVESKSSAEIGCYCFTGRSCHPPRDGRGGDNNLGPVISSPGAPLHSWRDAVCENGAHDWCQSQCTDSISEFLGYVPGLQAWVLPGGMPLSVFIIEYTNFKLFLDNVEVLSWFSDSSYIRNAGQLRELAFIWWLNFNIFIMTIVSYNTLHIML
jgi:hypothetical protein